MIVKMQSDKEKRNRKDRINSKIIDNSIHIISKSEIMVKQLM